VQNCTLCADREIARVGFTSPEEIKAFVDDLERNGLTYLADGSSVDIVVADQQSGLMARVKTIPPTLKKRDSMTTNISLGELPQVLIDAIVQHLTDYSVGFVRVEDTPTGETASLLGSGTLVSAGSKRAVLTAHHVVSILPKTGCLGLILKASQHRDTVDTQGLTYLKIAQGQTDAEGPDLGAVLLAPTIATAIAAHKTFYDLERYREQMLSAPPHLHDGPWFVNGFIAENTVEERGRYDNERVMRFCNFSGSRGPRDPVVVGQHDYFAFPVEPNQGSSVFPTSFWGYERRWFVASAAQIRRTRPHRA
jgi:hypothetical protein